MSPVQTGGRGGAAKQRRSGGSHSLNAPRQDRHNPASRKLRQAVIRGRGRPPLRRASLDTSPPIDGGEERREFAGLGALPVPPELRKCG
ncbi:hypothetical protein EOA13_35075 [Mesorhizobium sp. M7A.F.Ca.US.011.01.1.1]|nr:hypothetical protein EOA13_35075 [Mesorhizobium sp. M7A.F.Ca.US.011.01.1.1]